MTKGSLPIELYTADATHPDLGGTTDGAILLNEAYAVLKDPTRRAAYDRLFLEQFAATTEASGTAVPPHERRRAIRLPYHGHIQVRATTSHTISPGQCRDVSQLGLSFRTFAALKAGLSLGIIFADDPGLILEGATRWHRIIPQRFGLPLYEGGIEFTDVNLQRFQQFCERTGLSF